MSKLDEKMPYRRVVILVYDGVQPIDFSGPAQVFTTANAEGASPPYLIQVSALTKRSVQTTAGFSVNAEDIGPEEKVDTLIIPGGPGVHELMKGHNRFHDELGGLCNRARRVCSVCTGAFLLARTGNLDGRRAVTHWSSCARLSTEFPNIRVEPDSLFLKDDHIWTSAGVTAGIDLCLALVEEDHDAGLAAKVARRLVVYLRRPGGQDQYSEPLSLQTSAGARYADLLHQMSTRPEFLWTVEYMAETAGQSLRTFHRKFRDEVGVTPSKALEKIRGDLARIYLTTTPMRLKQIALKTGFDSESALRDAIVRQFGISPQEIRERF